MMNTTPVDPGFPIAVTLTAGEWNGVLATLSEGRYSVVSPLIQKIIEQAQAAHQQQGAGDELRPRPHLQPAG
jgi:hypothetical protein